MRLPRPLRLLRPLALALALALTLGCTGPQVVVDRAPPSPKEEPRAAKPAGDVFWMDGRWEWDPEAQHFYWVPGRWAEPRAGRIWLNAYWEPTETGKYRYVPERWDRTN